MSNDDMDHGLTLTEDDDGWAVAECGCGWISPPCPDDETAAGFWGDHRSVLRAVPDVTP